MPESSRDEELELLRQRLGVLEAEKRVRLCMNRYMYLCDVLDVGFNLDDLLVLFTADAVWEGKGNRYGGTFGRHDGRNAIKEMFAKYTKAPAHFMINVHFLANELIDVDGDSAEGSWLLLQPSTFASGDSQLSSARITARFRLEEGEWRICHFQTENLFSRPVKEPWDNSAPLPVPE